MEQGTIVPMTRRGGTTVGLETVLDGLANPVCMACPADGSGRMFIVDQVGKVHLLVDGEATLFLDISEDMVDLDPGYDERGLLGMAFHPRFDQNGKFYLYYNAPPETRGWNSTSVLSEYAMEDGRPREVRTVLKVQQPQMNHNGGHICFGPDGMLYVPLGDGGAQNDKGLGHNPETGNGQDLNTMLGKVLRIDVDHPSEGREYGIPEDNPFASGGGRPEIFAYGFRNPAYAAFDAETGDLFVADAGQDRYEEVNLVVRGGNYGWRIREGAHCFDPDNPRGNPTDCPDRGARGEELIDPIGELTNSALPGGEGATVIGGAPYRGSIEALNGGYVFGAFSGGGSPLFVLFPDGGNWTRRSVPVDGPSGLVPGYLLAVALDQDGEVLVLGSGSAGPSGTSGKVWRLVER